ncbi:MAG: RecQ family ATP-dependent DNA helicase [Muribaculaceae bacterium]|nr:RecQ family ATP-dependent DNA helicase [Muribaculaceae bacterium]
MSFWRKIIEGFKSTESETAPTERNDSLVEELSVAPGSVELAYVDVEVGNDRKIHDIGALKEDGSEFHEPDKNGLMKFLDGTGYLCGHNIVHHDVQYLLGKEEKSPWTLVDTLFMSPILFPERPYHRLVKDYKLISDQMNNPLNDCKLTRELLHDEINKWNTLPAEIRLIFATLLKGKPEFEGFLRLVKAEYAVSELTQLIRKHFHGKICSNADIETIIGTCSTELTYALALIDTEHNSITPGWVLHNYPHVEYIVKQLRLTRCSQGCDYCNKQLDTHRNLKLFFGYDEFRTYEGEPLQEKAAEAAVGGKSLLAVFPTGGGKSLTFQLPALMANRAVHGLTVVISPLQSLMKDQVDNLADRGITEAVTINGLLDPITRALSLQRVQDGEASLLYIAPEMLRSKTIQRILQTRNVVRFVIDEAHCFSSWGQDFRVDYLYIGKFIRKLQSLKKSKQPIAVSCFTATAKQKVIQDICDYFRRELHLELELFASGASRSNLRYSVIHVENESEKYSRLRDLISVADCPTIVYVSRTKRTFELAAKLSKDGYRALPFNGKMESEKKIANQEAFMNDNVRIIVATSAFGMGVDKSDVGLVVHYDISDSLENYVQEAGRAGRDPRLNARCFVLYSDDDLDKHFILLNQTKLSLSEIQQVWKAVKDLTRKRNNISCSALEIARQAGWDDSVSDIETRVRTALSALEQNGYIERGDNIPHVYATGISVKNIDEARKRISESVLFESEEIENAVRIIKSLISQKYIAMAQADEAESRVDYLADILGMQRKEVVSVVTRMRQEGILADNREISAYLSDAGDSERKSNTLLERFARLERFILNHIPDESLRISCKQFNENAVNDGITTSREKDIRTLIYFLTVTGYTHKTEDSGHNLELKRQADMEVILRRFEKRLEICRFALPWLYKMTADAVPGTAIQFSIVELLNDINKENHTIFGITDDIRLEDVEEALLYMSKIGALKLEGGFLVLYNAMNITRLKDSKFSFKHDDYRTLDEFYKLKIQQIHIVGEYANLMVKNYEAALQYVKDYFGMDYRKFVLKYFKGTRLNDIKRNVTPHKYNQLFGLLSPRQKEIISDNTSRCIVVAAGPGSGKTRVLVHKLASLLLLEDVKHEQLLMLTFSRSAATEFKQRLIGLIGNAAHFVEIKTFHSYCFDLLGRIGNLDEAKNVVASAAKMISEGEVEPNKIGKTVIVIDEAQDMGENEYALVSALKDNNEEMRIIAVGDDDQNIFEFRGSDSKFLFQLSRQPGSRLIEMTENYRSARHPVVFANAFLKTLEKRLKSNPVISMSDEDGKVEVTHYKTDNICKPLVDHILQNRTDRTTCVLTQTNNEAATVVALLRRNGVNSKLIQSMDGFQFRNLMEIRFFTKYLDNRVDSPCISDTLWEEAIKETKHIYKRSSALGYFERCVAQFRKINRSLYLNDFKEFVNESSVEDFCDLTGTEVVVSTIHKAKGREFDDVYMLISDKYKLDDKLKRRYYVGLTRAKKHLYIHTNSNYFNNLPADNYHHDASDYPPPEEIMLQMSMKDVYLGFFRDRKKDVLSLRGGDRLIYKDGLLFVNGVTNAVGCLSTKMKEELADWHNKGYTVTSSSVQFIVAWKPKDAPREEPETAILLANLVLNR